MSGLDRVVCVHVAAFGRDVELRFPRARYAIEAGALRVASDSDAGEDFMALAPGMWKAAWFEDSSGRPLGLSPSSPSEAPNPQPASASSAPGPMAEGPAHSPTPSRVQPTAAMTLVSPPATAVDSVPSAPAPTSREMLSSRIFNTLDSKPYPGLLELSTELGVPQLDVERVLSAALQKNAIDAETLSVASIQQMLDTALPHIIATRQPKGLREMLSAIKERPDGFLCDYIQLQIWIKRNPPKRPGEST